MESPKQDWFEFSQTTTIDGQELSFTEISRLLVENQGYIKTSSGYVKVSEESQQELKTLNHFMLSPVKNHLTCWSSYPYWV